MRNLVRISILLILFSFSFLTAQAQYFNASNSTLPTAQKEATTREQPKQEPKAVKVSRSRTDYVPLISGFPPVQPDAKTGDFAGYVNSIIQLVIGLTGILAVLMIIVGGIQYVSTDSWTGKDSGKKRIQAAVGGLILALSSFLILNSIDPSLTYLNFAKSLKPGGDLKESKFGVQTANTSPYGPDFIGPISPNQYPAGTTVTPTGSVPTSDSLTPVGNGDYEITPAKVALDNDGRSAPPFVDSSYQPRTSHTINGQYLDAAIDQYVVVPVGSSIPLGTSVTITNHTTGLRTVAIVGDRGPGFGEMSRAAAIAIGSWKEGMGDSISRHNITYTFHTGK